jgi:hypothetical protein
MKKLFCICTILCFFSVFAQSKLIGTTLLIDLSNYKQYGITYQNTNRVIEVLPIFENMPIEQCIIRYEKYLAPNDNFVIENRKSYGNDKQSFDIRFGESEPDKRVYFISNSIHTCILLISYISHLTDQNDLEDLHQKIMMSKVTDQIPNINELPNYTISIKFPYTIKTIRGNSWSIVRNNVEISASFYLINVNTKIKTICDNTNNIDYLRESKRISNIFGQNSIWFSKFVFDNNEVKNTYVVKKGSNILEIRITKDINAIDENEYNLLAKSIRFK